MFCVRNQFCLSVAGCQALSPSLHMHPFLSIFAQPPKSLNQYYAAPSPFSLPARAFACARAYVRLCSCVTCFCVVQTLRSAYLANNLPVTGAFVPPFSVPLCPCLLFLYLFVRVSFFCTSLSVPPFSVPLCPCLLFLYLFVCASFFCTSLSVTPFSVPLCP